jgi:serine/alanine racemase
MPVVKADAYGHGAEMSAARLQREGIKAFAVATVEEGAYLRDSGLTGKILVLGYTHPGDAGFLNTLNMSQLVFDGAYAKALDGTGYKINVHIAIDTGMHRLGIDVSNEAEIESVYSYNNLTVEGVATHLASSDSLDAEDIKFTNTQMERFLTVINTLKSKGYDVGKLHTQASYGVYNYPDMQCDYARVGIALYGIMSYDGDTKIKPALRPVMSLRALIAQVKWIGAGEGVSYGRTFIADKPMKLATVCIGYADGIPRQMSGNGGVCIVRGHKVPVIGRICMDMLMVDVTGIDDVAAGDIATLIGKDRGEEIRCEDVAAASGTISNDIVSRIGGRLQRIYSDRKGL